MPTNKRINDLLKKADNDFEKNYTEAESELLKAYRRALDRVKQKIALIYEDYGPKPTITQLYKNNRLLSLEKQILEEIKNLTQTSANLISISIKDSYINSYYTTGFALEVGSGIELGFTMLPKKAIEYAISDNLWLDSLKNNSAKLILDNKYEIESVLRSNAREEIVSGLAEGKSYGSVAKAIGERFNVSATRSKTITFTEMHKAHSHGRVQGLDTAKEAAAELGLKAHKVWRHNAVGIPREDHLAADGQLDNNDGMFKVGGELLPGPGLGTDPKNNINCHCNADFNLEGIDSVPQNRYLKDIKNIDEYKNFKEAT